MNIHIYNMFYICTLLYFVPEINLFVFKQRRSQDFCLGGATRYIFRHLSPGADRIQWGGGGVVADICSSRNFP